MSLLKICIIFVIYLLNAKITTRDQSNSIKRRIVFRQMAAHIMNIAKHAILMLFNGRGNHPKLPLTMGGSWPPSNTWLLGPTAPHRPNAISIEPAVSSRLTLHYPYTYYGTAPSPGGIRTRSQWWPKIMTHAQNHGTRGECVISWFSRSPRYIVLQRIINVLIFAFAFAVLYLYICSGCYRQVHCYSPIYTVLQSLLITSTFVAAF